MVSEVSREASSRRTALCETGRKDLCLLTLSPACLPNADAAALPFYRMTVNTVSITSRPSTRGSAPGEQTCSPPSPAAEFQRSLPAKASAWKKGCVTMVFTTEEFLQPRMQPQCETFSGLLWGQRSCLSSFKSKKSGCTFLSRSWKTCTGFISHSVLPGTRRLRASFVPGKRGKHSEGGETKSSHGGL